MILGLKGATYEEKLAELGLTSLEERRHETDMLQTFKILRGFDRVSSRLLILWTWSLDTSFSNSEVELWNMVPVSSEQKMPELSTSSKKPTRGTEWKWWEPPNKKLRPDPARGENQSRNRLPPRRFYLDHRRSTNKYL